MVAAEIGSLLLYAASMAFLPQYFGQLFSISYRAAHIANTNIHSDLSFVLSVRFLWKVAIIVGKLFVQTGQRLSKSIWLICHVDRRQRLPSGRVQDA